MTNLNGLMQEMGDRVAGVLDEVLAPVAGPRGTVIEAMRYACLGGGKRLRPFLVIASADIFDVRRCNSLRVGAAIEMIHCYSLIHDDLPCMDDADTRRGRPSLHKAFDEATAILAGDGLLTEAFGVIADEETHESAQVRGELAGILAQAAGSAGMVGGQMLDIAPERVGLDLDGISELQRLKTGALINFSCVAGAILAQASRDDLAALTSYAEDLGLIFQITDDLLDVEGNEEEVGKPVGQDCEADKATFVKILGADGARAKAQELAETAHGSLERFNAHGDPLHKIVDFVLERRS